MCGAIQIQENKVFFPHPNAKLPVRRRDGELQWITWGKRREEQCAFPEGGWARLTSIKDGRWTRLNPRPVQIVVERFMEKDVDGQRYWFDLEEGEFIQGLLATLNGETRVYVVTQEAEPQTAMIHPRWPRILTFDEVGSKASADAPPDSLADASPKPNAVVTPVIKQVSTYDDYEEEERNYNM